jgi:hypothetical protein
MMSRAGQAGPAPIVISTADSELVAASVAAAKRDEALQQEH